MPDPSAHPLVQVLEATFAAQLENGDIDLVIDLDTQEFELQADEWTLHLAGWPVSAAFIALDDEPTSASECAAALNTAIDHRDIAALRQANALLDNMVAITMEASGDLLSSSLALSLAVHQAADGDLDT